MVVVGVTAGESPYVDEPRRVLWPDHLSNMTSSRRMRSSMEADVGDAVSESDDDEPSEGARDGEAGGCSMAAAAAAAWCVVNDGALASETTF